MLPVCVHWPLPHVHVVQHPATSPHRAPSNPHQHGEMYQHHRVDGQGDGMGHRGWECDEWNYSVLCVVWGVSIRLKGHRVKRKGHPREGTREPPLCTYCTMGWVYDTSSRLRWSTYVNVRRARNASPCHPHHRIPQGRTRACGVTSSHQRHDTRLPPIQLQASTHPVNHRCICPLHLGARRRAASSPWRVVLINTVWLARRHVVEAGGERGFRRR